MKKNAFSYNSDKPEWMKDREEQRKNQEYILVPTCEVAMATCGLNYIISKGKAYSNMAKEIIKFGIEDAKRSLE